VKLICVPGLDGAGLLFSSFLDALNRNGQHDTATISYDRACFENLDSFARFIRDEIARCSQGRPYVLLLESFSTCLMPQLLGQAELRGIVLVAGFLSPPNKLIVAAKKMRLLKPLAIISKYLPWPSFLLNTVIRSPKDRVVLKHQIKQIPTQTLTNRLTILASLPTEVGHQSVPISGLYLRSQPDFLVWKNRHNEFQSILPNLKTIDVSGPHFLLQSQPELCAQHTTEFITSI